MKAKSPYEVFKQRLLCKSGRNPCDKSTNLYVKEQHAVATPEELRRCQELSDLSKKVAARGRNAKRVLTSMQLADGLPAAKRLAIADSDVGGDNGIVSPYALALAARTDNLRINSDDLHIPEGSCLQCATYERKARSHPLVRDHFLVAGAGARHDGLPVHPYSADLAKDYKESAGVFASFERKTMDQRCAEWKSHWCQRPQADGFPSSVRYPTSCGLLCEQANGPAKREMLRNLCEALPRCVDEHTCQDRGKSSRPVPREVGARDLFLVLNGMGAKKKNTSLYLRCSDALAQHAQCPARQMYNVLAARKPTGSAASSAGAASAYIGIRLRATRVDPAVPEKHAKAYLQCGSSSGRLAFMDHEEVAFKFCSAKNVCIQVVRCESRTHNGRLDEWEVTSVGKEYTVSTVSEVELPAAPARAGAASASSGSMAPAVPVADDDDISGGVALDFLGLGTCFPCEPAENIEADIVETETVKD